MAAAGMPPLHGVDGRSRAGCGQTPRLRRGDDDVTEILSLEEGVRLTGQHPIELGVADADGFAGW